MRKKQRHALTGKRGDYPNAPVVRVDHEMTDVARERMLMRHGHYRRKKARAAFKELT